MLLFGLGSNGGLVMEGTDFLYWSLGTVLIPGSFHCDFSSVSPFVIVVVATTPTPTPPPDVSGILGALGESPLLSVGSANQSVSRACLVLLLLLPFPSLLKEGRVIEPLLKARASFKGLEEDLVVCLVAVGNSAFSMTVY